MRILLALLLSASSLFAQARQSTLLLFSAAGGAPTSPVSSGLLHQWDATAVTNSVHDSDVVRWVDSASSTVAINDLTAPKYVSAANGPNGKPAVQFIESSSTRMYFNPIGVTNFTVQIALQSTNNSGYGGIFSYRTNGWGFNISARSSSDWIPHLTVLSNSTEIFNQQITTVTHPTGWRTLSFTWEQGVGATAQTNGVADTLSGGEAGWGSMWGWIGWAYNYQTWRCGEILVYNRVLNSTELAANQSYLKNKWGTE